MQPKVLVTGATGNVGREVVAALEVRGIMVTAAGQDQAAMRDLFDAGTGTGTRTVRLNFLDPSTWREAVTGHDHLFLMRPPAISDVHRNLNPFIDAARDAGIDHIVFLSVAGAGKSRIVPHRKVEDHLRARGDHHTNLRPGFFAQNLHSAYRLDILEDHRIYVPAGNKPVNWIDVRDVAEVAGIIFEDPTVHRGKSYTLNGPGAVPWPVVAEALSSSLGRDIRYEPGTA